GLSGAAAGQRQEQRRGHIQRIEVAGKTFTYLASPAVTPPAIAAVSSVGRPRSFMRSRRYAAVSGQLRSTFAVKAWSAIISGVQPRVVFASSFAPCSTRYVTTVFTPRTAAPCRAVAPSQRMSPYDGASVGSSAGKTYRYRSSAGSPFTFSWPYFVVSLTL